MKKSLILISIVSSFLFSTLAYGVDWAAHFNWMLGSDDMSQAVICPEKTIKDTKKEDSSSNKNVKEVEKSKNNDKTKRSK